MNLRMELQRHVCGCCDEGCRAHGNGDHCMRELRGTEYWTVYAIGRIPDGHGGKWIDYNGTDVCYACGEDALSSGLFTLKRPVWDGIYKGY